MKFRLMTYNILQGGSGREQLIFEVISAMQPDVVILQELNNSSLLEDFATRLQMHHFFAQANRQILRDNGKIGFLRRNIGLLSRFPITSFNSYHSFPVRRTLLEATVEYAPGQELALFGVHLKASLALSAEIWRVWEVATIVRRTKIRKTEKCLVAGDFNTIGKQDRALIADFPPLLKALVWLQFGKLYRFAIPKMIQADFVDCFRKLQPSEDGFTLPTPKPNTRLDYIFVSPSVAANLHSCEVVTIPPAVQQASDHYPVIADFEL